MWFGLPWIQGEIRGYVEWLKLQVNDLFLQILWLKLEYIYCNEVWWSWEWSHFAEWDQSYYI